MPNISFGSVFVGGHLLNNADNDWECTSFQFASPARTHEENLESDEKGSDAMKRVKPFAGNRRHEDQEPSEGRETRLVQLCGA